MKYIKETGVIAPHPHNHWRFIPKEWAQKAAEHERKILFGNDSGSKEEEDEDTP